MQLPICHRADEQHSDMYFAAITVVNLYHFVVIIDHVGHEYDSLGPKLLRVECLRGKWACSESGINKKVCWSKEMVLLFDERNFTEVNLKILNQVKC